jgi:hypothetical protein
MTLALLLMIVGLWLSWISRPRPRSRPGITIEIEVRRVPRNGPTAHIRDVDSRGGL